MTIIKNHSFDIYLAKPRGFCAGVERAIEVVRKAIKRFKPPVYVRHAIVHNLYVVKELEKEGAIFVENMENVPSGSVIIFSAHGVPPSVEKEARERGLIILDATCPLVTKVHSAAVMYASMGYSVLLIGHRGHVEVEGTMGEAPDSIVLVESPGAAREVEVPDPERVSCITQTTLSIDDAEEIVNILVRRFPNIRKPGISDICYATQNRQNAVKKLCPLCDLIIVIGSQTSSNSNRLREVAEKYGKMPAFLVEEAEDIESSWLEGVKRIGVTSGASTPEDQVHAVIEKLKSLGAKRVLEIGDDIEDTHFVLPAQLRDQ